MGHLREALSEPCMICGILPLSVRKERLRQVEGLLFGYELPPSGVACGCSGPRKQRGPDGEYGECSSPELKRVKEKALQAFGLMLLGLGAWPLDVHPRRDMTSGVACAGTYV